MFMLAKNVDTKCIVLQSSLVISENCTGKTLLGKCQDLTPRKTNFCFLTAYFSHFSSAFTGTSFDMQGEISMHDWSPTIGLQD